LSLQENPKTVTAMAKAMTEDQKESPQKTNAMFVVNMVTGHRNVPEEMVMV